MGWISPSLERQHRPFHTHTLHGDRSAPVSRDGLSFVLASCKDEGENISAPTRPQLHSELADEECHEDAATQQERPSSRLTPRSSDSPRAREGEGRQVRCGRSVLAEVASCRRGLRRTSSAWSSAHLPSNSHLDSLPSSHKLAWPLPTSPTSRRPSFVPCCSLHPVSASGSSEGRRRLRA